MQNSALKSLEDKFYTCWFLTDDAWPVFLSSCLSFNLANEYIKILIFT